MAALERAILQTPIEVVESVTDLPSVISERTEKARQLAKGLLEITCGMENISVADYISKLTISSHVRSRVKDKFFELNQELGSPIPLEIARSTLMWPPPKPE